MLKPKSSLDPIASPPQRETRATEAILAYAAGRAAASPEPESLAEVVLRLSSQLADLTAQVAQLRQTQQRADQLEHTVKLLTDYIDRLHQSYRELEAGVRRHVADRRSLPGQLELGIPSTASLTDEIQPELTADPQEPETAEVLSPQPTGQGGESDTPSDKRPPKNRHAHGRRKLDTELPKLVVESLPTEVLVRGLENYRFVGFEDSSTVAYRRAGHILLVERRGKYVPRSSPAPEAATDSTPKTDSQDAAVVRELEVLVVPTETDYKHNPFPCGALVRYLPPLTLQDSDALTSPVLIAPLPERAIPRGLPDASLLAHLLVGKMDYHLPYYRQEREHEQLGLTISRTNMVRWHFEAGGLVSPLVEAMRQQALGRSWFGMDATGTAIFAKEKYRKGHIFVMVAPGDSVVFQYTPKYDSTTVQALFGGYTGIIVADASANHNGLFGPGAATEAGCFAHCRRYFIKAYREGYRTPANEALLLIKQLFGIEREIALLSPEERLRIRQERSAPIVDDFFSWVAAHKGKVSDSTSLGRALTYATNQHQALRAFLACGEIPIHNNASEGALRQVVKGRRAWLCMGSDDHAKRSCAIYSLVASCHLHGLDPEFYLQELLTVLPSWSTTRLLELSPKHWVQTRQRLIAEGRLRYIDLGLVLEGKLGLRS